MAERVIPVELETGIPLSIAPRNDLPRPWAVHEEANQHHAIYPKARRELSALSGRAMRLSRLEWVSKEEHGSYHHYFDEYIAQEWEFPETTAQRFGGVILLASGYVPSDGIRCDRSGPNYVQLSSEDRENMWNHGLIRVASDFDVYKFIRGYILKQKLGTEIVEEGIIEQFLTTKDFEKRTALGAILLNAAVEMAADSVRPLYTQAYKNRLIKPGLQAEPKDLIISQPFALGTPKRKRKTITALRRNLAARYGVNLADAA